MSVRAVWIQSRRTYTLQKVILTAVADNRKSQRRGKQHNHSGRGMEDRLEKFKFRVMETNKKAERVKKSRNHTLKR